VIAARLWVVFVLSACSGPATPPPIVPLDYQPRSAESCELPRGVKLRELDPRERGLVLRRVFACNDFRRGRITQADYVSAIAAIDAEWGRMPERPASPRSIVWASSVRGLSTQYGAPQWAATQVLGAPNVFPRHGDIPQAWASLKPDDGAEWIEVGFEQSSSIGAVVVYETFNPGAISRVALISNSGAVTEAPLDKAVAETSSEGSVRRRFDIPCTSYRVEAVRLELDSARVPGWTEIDAIGLLPCGP
jgi:hypothetical protein